VFHMGEITCSSSWFGPVHGRAGAPVGSGPGGIGDLCETGGFPKRGSVLDATRSPRPAFDPEFGATGPASIGDLADFHGCSTRASGLRERFRILAPALRKSYDTRTVTLRRSEVVQGQDYEVRVVGAPRAGFRDAYHWLLTIPWWAAIAIIVGGYLLINTLFALAYLAAGGIANAAPGSFVDAFFFSVQTIGTIGYGTMYPATRLANSLVVAESVCGLLVMALATGLVFVRFSLTRARVVFSSRVAIGPIDGVPTLMIRVGNERRGRIVDATFRLTLARTEFASEGTRLYRSVDLSLMRSHATVLARSWMVLHRLTSESPLAGATPGSLAASEAELTLAVAGTDETSLQAVHAQQTWSDRSIVWGARLADILADTPDGNLLMDLTRFHELTPTLPVPGFPYGAGPES